MNKIIRLSIIAWLPLFLGAQNEPDTSYLDKLKPEITKEINSLMKKHKVTGLSIALVDDQKIVWSEGFGYADKENDVKATDRTVYRVGSVSKLFTAIATMQSVENGLVHIDSAYTKYVPEFSIKSRYEDVITPRSLMTHHSGLPGDLLHGLLSDSAAHYSSIVPMLKNEYTAYPVNYVFAYSNLGVSLEGYLVEKVNQQRFEDMLKFNVFKPMRMVHSSFEMPEHCKKYFSKAYRKGKEETDPGIREAPAGTMVSNVLDLSNFIKMVFADGTINGNTILKPETLSEMLTPQNSDVPLDLGFRIGLAFFLSEPSLQYASRFAGHNGDTDLFHAALAMLTDHKIGVVILTNSEGGGGARSELTRTVLKKVIEYKKGIAAPEPSKKYPAVTMEKPADSLLPYTGLYGLGIEGFRIDLKKGHLHAKMGGQNIYLLANDSGMFTPKLVLFGLIPVKAKDQLVEFIRFGDKTYMKAKSLKSGYEALMAVKIDNYNPHSEWLNKTGEYELLNKGDDHYFPENISLIYEDGLLRFKFKFFDNKINMLLQTLNDTEAINAGIGRYANETLYFSKNTEGEDILHCSGYEFRKIEVSEKK